MEKTVRHTFVSTAGIKSGATYLFNFVEPIRSIIGGRISGVIIKRFLTVDLSYVYFLRTDGLYGSRTITFLNGQPDYTSFAICNKGLVGTLSFARYNDDGNFYKTFNHDLWGIQFTLLDVFRNEVEPPDPGWSFTVEIEFLIKA